MNQKKSDASRHRAPVRPRGGRSGAPSKAPQRQANSSSLPHDSLAYSLEASATVVGAVRAGAALPAALAAIFANRAPAVVAASGRTPLLGPDDADDDNDNDAIDHSSGAASATSSAAKSDWHGATQDIAYRTLRVLARVDALIAAMVPKAPAPQVRDLLACALALLQAQDAPYTAHTVVDQAVRACAASAETAFARGMVNAVLRNFLRESERLLAQVCTDLSARWNYPRWWIETVKRAWPEQWEAILSAGDVQAPLTLRVNRRHASPETYLETLDAAGIAAELAGPTGVRLRRAVAVERLPGFVQGHVSVQDAGAQQAALLLEVQDGMRVLDACAAPGGKTGHLLEMANVQLVALESDPTRARRIGENLARLGLRAEVKIGDAGHPVAPWWDDKPFDRVLADVPCSASGIVRRHPDIRWLRRPEDIKALIQEQRRILDALWQTVAPEGILLYVTCSIFPEENEEQAVWFESSRQDAVRLAAPGQLLPTVASAGSGADHDGFFYARFQKR